MTTPIEQDFEDAAHLLGLGSPEERAATDAAWNKRAAIEWGVDLVAAAEAAVELGDYSPAQVAAQLLAQGATAAHEVFVQRWQAYEAAERAVEEAQNLDYLSADEWAAKAEQIQLERQWVLEDELERAREDLARKELAGLTEAYRQYVETTPGARADAERLSNLLRQHVIETESVPDTQPEREKLVRHAAHTIAVADDVVGSLREQARIETRLRAKEWARTGESTTKAAWDKKVATAEEERFQELLESTPVAGDVLRLPATPAEMTAREVERRQQANDREETFRDQVGSIRANASLPGERDRGASHVRNKTAYREALARAEMNAEVYVPPAPVVRDPSAPVDEYGPGLL